MTDLFSRWRRDLTAELESAEREHARATEATAAAGADAARAKIAARELSEAFDRLPSRTPVAGVLSDMRRRAEDDFSATTGRVALARGSEENARRRLADIRQALAQLDAIAPASMPAAEEPAAEEIAA